MHYSASSTGSHPNGVRRSFKPVYGHLVTRVSDNCVEDAQVTRVYCTISDLRCGGNAYRQIIQSLSCSEYCFIISVDCGTREVPSEYGQLFTG